jgi:carbon monoxide dehydrogenase subunit G
MATSTSIEVHRPAPEVFAYVTDPSRFSEWQNGVVDGHRRGDGPALVGDKCVNTRLIGFAKRQVTSEITCIDAPRTWSVRGIDGPIRAAVDVKVEPLEDGKRSRVTITLDFTGHGIGKLIVPLVIRPQAAKEMHTNMQQLKQRLEASA